MIRILVFRHLKFGDLLPLVDGPEYFRVRIGDIIYIGEAKYRLEEVLTSSLTA